jgi:DNA-binding HxlR family transcriptional regulator
MRWNELSDESCSVARTVSAIGDRWTILVLRDCFLRVRRFEQFQERLGITRHILADRLRKLVKLKILMRVPYQKKPLRHEYRLTERGLALHPVLLALAHWGDAYMAGPRGKPLLFVHRCGHVFDPAMTCSACGETVAPHDVRVRPGPGAPRHGTLIPVQNVKAMGGSR